MTSAQDPPVREFEPQSNNKNTGITDSKQHYACDNMALKRIRTLEMVVVMVNVSRVALLLTKQLGVDYSCNKIES